MRPPYETYDQIELLYSLFLIMCIKVKPWKHLLFLWASTSTVIFMQGELPLNTVTHMPRFLCTVREKNRQNVPIVLYSWLILARQWVAKQCPFGKDHVTYAMTLITLAMTNREWIRSFTEADFFSYIHTSYLQCVIIWRLCLDNSNNFKEGFGILSNANLLKEFVVDVR